MTESSTIPAPVTRIQSAILKEARKILQRDGGKEAKNVIKAAIKEHLFENSSEVIIAKEKATASQRDNFLFDLFLIHSEITESFETLCDLPILAGSKPHGNAKISEARRLTFWREVYWNEYYIFYQRVESLLTFVQRKFRKEALLIHNAARLSALSKVLKDIYAQIIKDRGQHVHKKRIGSTDPTLERLSFLRLLSTDNNALITAEYKKALKDCKQDTQKRIRSLNRLTKATLKTLYTFVSPVLLDAEGNLIYPKGLQG